MAQKKYTDGSGVSEIWLNVKNYVYSQLLGYSQTGHTHTKSEITDFPTIPTKTSDLTNDSGFITSDNTKIPLAGSSQISGDLIPATDNSIDIGSSTKNIKMLYTKGITIDGAQFLPSDYVTLNDAQTIPGNKTFSGLTKTTGKLPYFYSGNDLNNAIYNIETTYWDSNTANIPSSSDYGTLLTFNREVNVHTSYSVGWIAQLGIGTNSRLYLRTKTNLGGAWENWKEFITINEAVPRSGGAVMTGPLGNTVNNSFFDLYGGTGHRQGAQITLFGKDSNGNNGAAYILLVNASQYKAMYFKPDGTWTWDGQAVQLISDQRLKQQINQIDDKLLDAWQDVELCQFKYNDAVDQKGDKARLHTGYVVQQINSACKSHGVDVSQYGLYCHEEYPEETEEVEVEQADGTKTKERKVIREASEHYSLRYTEVYAIECMYLRRCIARLTARIEELEKSNNTK